MVVPASTSAASPPICLFSSRASSIWSSTQGNGNGSRDAMVALSGPLYRWLTNRIKAPTPINTAIRIPTINEVTGCRCSIGFDPALFCAAPMPNQKRRLLIDWLQPNPKVAEADRLSIRRNAQLVCGGQRRPSLRRTT